MIWHNLSVKYRATLHCPARLLLTAVGQVVVPRALRSAFQRLSRDYASTLH